MTPQEEALGDQLGFVTDLQGIMVIDRMFTDGEALQRLSPMALAEVVGEVNRRRPTLMLTQSGEFGEWLIIPTGAAVATPRRTTDYDAAALSDLATCGRIAADELLVVPLICAVYGQTIHGTPADLSDPAYASAYHRAMRNRRCEACDWPLNAGQEQRHHSCAPS